MFSYKPLSVRAAHVNRTTHLRRHYGDTGRTPAHRVTARYDLIVEICQHDTRTHLVNSLTHGCVDRHKTDMPHHTTHMPNKQHPTRPHGTCTRAREESVHADQLATHAETVCSVLARRTERHSRASDLVVTTPTARLLLWRCPGRRTHALSAAGAPRRNLFELATISLEMAEVTSAATAVISA